MKIKSIECENFRPFLGKTRLDFVTDGRINIIYGTTGAGKTTLHQLFQWIIYGYVNFNATSSNKLYNTKFADEVSLNKEFEVIGKMEFSDNGVEYILTRTNTYVKKISEVKEKSKSVMLFKQDCDLNWIKVTGDIELFLDKLMPIGLSKYFFFDGERMISDLKEKGYNASKNLQEAMYSIFDLNIYKNASKHIGEGKTSVLEKLKMSKTSKSKPYELEDLKYTIDGLKDKIEKYEKKIKSDGEVVERNKIRIQELSEIIGEAKSKEAYEEKRKESIIERDKLLKRAEEKKTEFGKELIAYFPMQLISRSIIDAKHKLKAKAESQMEVPGLTKELVDALLLSDKCLCGCDLNGEHRNNIERLLTIFPPISNQHAYDTFKRNSEKELGEKRYFAKIFLDDVINDRKAADKLDDDIAKIDEDMKAIAGLSTFVAERKKLETTNKLLHDKINTNSVELNKCNLLNKKYLEQYVSKVDNSLENNKIDFKVDIMEEVKAYFDNRLVNSGAEYSKKLKEAIQELLDKMLNAKRLVEMTNEFALRVVDNYDDEYKSEGQFAVVSFAYIGGIFKVLKGEQCLSNKEYPLVLDGPFSKLAKGLTQNVIDTVPNYASQIILFSKDDLSEYIKPELAGNIYTIKNSDEYTKISEVVEGYYGV